MPELHTIMIIMIYKMKCIIRGLGDDPIVPNPNQHKRICVTPIIDPKM